MKTKLTKIIRLAKTAREHSLKGGQYKDVENMLLEIEKLAKDT